MSEPRFERKRRIYNRIHILVVDDEEGIRHLLQTRLSGAGFRVITAANGFHGLQILKSPQQIDLALCDLSMPGMDGVQFYNEALEIKPELAFLLMTGRPDRPKIVHAIKSGVSDIILKPVKTVELFSKIETLLKIEDSE